ncbi:MAG: acylphosphatase [bacterium]
MTDEENGSRRSAGAEEPGGRQRLHLRLSGRVQGVGFRWFTHRAACARGLGGWVKNMPDGSVEMEVEGPPSTLQDFVENVEKGPAASRVDDLTSREMEPRGSDDFSIEY